MVEEEKSEYGKQSKGKLVAIYIVIAIVVYGAVYYFFFAKKSGYATSTQQAPITNQQASPASSSSVDLNPIQISNFSYSPASLTVKVGDTVSWTNQDSMGHSATADDNSFDTGIIDQGKTGTATFTKAGTFTYHCSVHPTMHGTIIVK